MSGRPLTGVLTVLAALAAFAAAPASAARPAAGPLTVYPETLNTAHFQIHYTGALVSPANPDRIIQQQAGDLAANAERAYDLFVTSWGYPAPRDDGDGRVDIWVQKQAAGAAKTAVSFDGATPSTVWGSIDPSVVADAHAAARAVMVAIQAGMWVPADLWLMKASAEWASFAFDAYTGAAGTSPAPDMSMDCESSSCGNTSYEIDGDSRWPFFQYLSERYGTSFVKDTFATGASLADVSKKGRDLLAATFISKGTTLGDAFNAYTAVHAAGAYTAPGLKDAAPATYSSVALGTVTATYPVQRVSVNHLAARYVKFARNASTTGACYTATLALTVALPAGSTSQPVFFASSLGTAAVPLAISGSTATLSVPWSTCAAGGDGYLALPNPSLTADAQTFTVAASLTVSSVSLTPPSTPPTPVYTGPVVEAPVAAVAPSILLLGSEAVRVPAATRLVRLLVFSSGVGQLRASVDSTVVATVALRPGNNDVRFVLPVAAVKSVRNVFGARAAGSTLSLTSLTSDGATAGETVTRALVVTQPPKKKTASRR